MAKEERILASKFAQKVFLMRGQKRKARLNIRRQKSPTWRTESRGRKKFWEKSEKGNLLHDSTFLPKTEKRWGEKRYRNCKKKGIGVRKDGILRGQYRDKNQEKRTVQSTKETGSFERSTLLGTQHKKRLES